MNSRNRIKIAGIALAVCLAFAAACAEPATLPLISFSSNGAQQRIAPSSAQVAFQTESDTAGGKLDVTIQPGADGYPGITIKPEATVWDLHAFGHVDLRVTNKSEKPMLVCLRVDADAPGSPTPWSTENVTVKPGVTDAVRVRFGYSWGRRDAPINPAKVNRILIFVGKSADRQSFRIEAIEAGGSPGEKPSLPPEQRNFKPKDGILLGAGTSVDPAKQLDHGKTEVALPVRDGKQSLHAAFPAAGESTLRLKPSIGRWDLSEFMQVKLNVRNTGPAAVTLQGQLESTAGKTEWPPAISIAPGAEQELIIPFGATSIWNGDPASGSQFESGTVTGVILKADGKDAGRELLVDSIRAIQPPPEQTPEWLGKRPPVAGNWTQTLDENFDGDTVDSTRWAIYGENYWDKQSHFTKANVILADGKVKLRFDKKRGHANDDPKKPETDYATGFLTSFGKWTQRYGYFEARMKLPTAPGLWPAFWMMPDRGASVPNPGSTENGGMEFDIMEYLTRFGPNRYNIAMHWDGYEKNHKSTGTEGSYVRADKDGYITSGMLWEPGRLTFYCNGKPLATWANPRISNVPAHLMFTLPCGGWGGNDLDDTGLPDDFVIDWVRCWQRDDLKNIAPPEKPAKTK